MPAAPDNPRGFWEDLEVVSINERVLAALSQIWWSATIIDDFQWQSPPLEPLASEAKHLLESRLERYRIWGFKDPRMCLLLPFWQPIFQKLGLAESYVIALRNPRAVADSLCARNEIVEEQAYLVWLKHVGSALNSTSGKTRVLVDYDELLRNPRHQLGRVAQQLGLRSPSPDDVAMQSYETEFLDRELRHHQHSTESSDSDSHYIKSALGAYETLRAIALEEQGRNADDLRAVAETIHAELSGLRYIVPLLRQLDLRMQMHERELIAAHNQANELESQCRERDNENLHLAADVDFARGQRDAATVERDAARVERDAATTERDTARAERDAARVERDAATTERDTARAERDIATAELEAVSKSIQELSLVNQELETRTQLKEASFAELHQREINRLWESRSWRLFRPFRNLVRMRRGLGKEIAPVAQSGIDALRIIVEIRQSISWELTAPLRLLHQIATSFRPTESAALPHPIQTWKAFQPAHGELDSSESMELSSAPWNSVSLSKAVQEVVTMLSASEQQLLFYLGRQYWRGGGAIVDCGPLVGGSTLPLAEGLASRQDRGIGRPIHVFDRFRAEAYMIDDYFRPAGFPLKEGDSLRPLFDANTNSVAEFLEVHECDITTIGWCGKPIEVLFIDLAKSWAINDHLLREFFPYLIPKRSIVIQQDYVHELCPWLHVTMELLAPFFEFIAYVPQCSVVYRLNRQIPAEYIRRHLVSRLPAADKLRLMDRAISRWSGAERATIECAKAILLWELGEYDSANIHLRLVERNFKMFPRVATAATIIRSQYMRPPASFAETHNHEE